MKGNIFEVHLSFQAWSWGTWRETLKRNIFWHFKNCVKKSKDFNNFSHKSFCEFWLWWQRQTLRVSPWLISICPILIHIIFFMCLKLLPFNHSISLNLIKHLNRSNRRALFVCLTKKVILHLLNLNSHV